MSKTRKAMLALALFVCLASRRELLAYAEDAKKPRMNVVCIVVDDLNCSLCCYGRPDVKTPNMDKLAAKGVQFNRAYCQFPLCGPSRASFLSGLRPDTTQIFDLTTSPRSTMKDTVFMGDYFHQNGYYTARVGKIGHTKALDPNMLWDVSEDAVKVKGTRSGKKKKAEGEHDGPEWYEWVKTNNEDKDEPDGQTARRIVELLEQNKDKPFFIAAGFAKPHMPLIAPKKYFDLYPPDKIQFKEAPADDRKDIPFPALNIGHDFPDTESVQKERIAAYYACVSFMDAQVGVIMEAMDRLKLWDNTVVILFGDHGWHLGEHGGLWAKMSLFEESARAPLICVAPGKKTGVSPRLVEFVDIYPTVVDLCELPTLKNVEGTSFRPLLEDPQRPWKKAAFTVVTRPSGMMGRSICTERYRYTEWGSEKTAELYDHEKDPQEFTNLAGKFEHAELQAELKKILHDGWQKAVP